MWRELAGRPRTTDGLSCRTMPSERVQRRIDRLLDQAESAADSADWNKVLEFVAGVLKADATNEDALTFKDMAEASLLQSGRRLPAKEH